MHFPKYIKSSCGIIGVFSHLTYGINSAVYKFDTGDFKFRQATPEEIKSGSDKLMDLTESQSLSMSWKQVSSSIWEAVGKYGKFRIERSRGKFWSCYISGGKSWYLRPTDKISAAKDKCERHSCWECTV